MAHAFRVIHGQVRFSDEFVRSQVAAAAISKAHACQGKDDPRPGASVRGPAVPAQGVSDAIGQRLGAGQPAGVGAHHEELVAPHPADRVAGPDRPTEALREQ